MPYRPNLFGGSANPGISSMRQQYMQAHGFKPGQQQQAAATSQPQAPQAGTLGSSGPFTGNLGNLLQNIFGQAPIPTQPGTGQVGQPTGTFVGDVINMGQINPAQKGTSGYLDSQGNWQATRPDPTAYQTGHWNPQLGGSYFYDPQQPRSPLNPFGGTDVGPAPWQPGQGVVAPGMGGNLAGDTINRVGSFTPVSSMAGQLETLAQAPQFDPYGVQGGTMNAGGLGMTGIPGMQDPNAVLGGGSFNIGQLGNLYGLANSYANAT